MRSAARGLAELSGLVHDGAGSLAAAVLSRAACLARSAGPALSPSQHDTLRGATLAMHQTITATAEQLTTTINAATTDLDTLLAPGLAAGGAEQEAGPGGDCGAGVKSVRGMLHRHGRGAGAAVSPGPRPLQTTPLTPEQARALHHYTTISGVEQLNRFLRRPGAAPEERREELRRLVDAAVAGLAALPGFDGVSYRGTTLPVVDLPRWRPGAVVADRGFASSSASAAVAEAFRRGGNAFITIAGRSGADIRSLSYFEHEAEVLFAPGTRFRVVGRSWDHRRECWSFQIEEVDPCASTATPTTP